MPNLTVAENIALSQIVEKGRRFIDWANVRRVAEHELRNIHAQMDLDAVVEDLSVPSRQLVAIARALTQDAKLIIMDEPTTALTKAEVNSLVAVINELRSRGISTLFISHKLDEVLEISERVTVIRDGRLVGVFPAADLTAEQLEAHMTGKPVEKQQFDSSADASGVPLLELRSWSREGHFSEVSFKMWKGEILGITGLLGSRRTELALSIFGMNPADSGKMFLNGERVDIRSTGDAVRHRIGYLPEDRVLQGLFESKSIGDNIIVTLLERLRGFLGLVSARKTREAISHWVEELKIKTSSSALPVSSLSGGNQQKVVIGKWLAIHPQLFILDNPTVGIDVASKAYIHGIMRDLVPRGYGGYHHLRRDPGSPQQLQQGTCHERGQDRPRGEILETSAEELYGFVTGNGIEIAPLRGILFGRTSSTCFSLRHPIQRAGTELLELLPDA